MIGASRIGEKLRSVHWQKMPFSCLDLTVREAHLGQWSQDPEIGRTYERKRSDAIAKFNPCKQGGRPHMNRGRRPRHRIDDAAGDGSGLL